MKCFAKIAALMTLVAMLGTARTASADESIFRDTFKSAIYGSVVGALAGTALIAFTKKPADHLGTVGYGAAAGVLAGTVYGVTKKSHAVVAIDNGKVTLAMPIFIPNLVESPVTGQTKVVWRADILCGTFN